MAPREPALFPIAASRLEVWRERLGDRGYALLSESNSRIPGDCIRPLLGAGGAEEFERRLARVKYLFTGHRAAIFRLIQPKLKGPEELEALEAEAVDRLRALQADVEAGRARPFPGGRHGLARAIDVLAGTVERFRGSIRARADFLFKPGRIDRTVLDRFQYATSDLELLVASGDWAVRETLDPPPQPDVAERIGALARDLAQDHRAFLLDLEAR